MADQPVTREKLINADKDIQVIEDFIKKPKDETVTTRFGDEIMTLKGLEEEVKKSGGYFKRYATLAAANADIANIPVNSVVKVTDVVDGGEYYKASASATSLTKSPFDIFEKVKDYSDSKIDELENNVEENTKHVKAISSTDGLYIVDELGAVVLKINKQGQVISKSSITESSDTQLLKTDEITALSNYGEYAFAIVDKDGRIALGVKRDGTVLPSFKNMLPAGGSNFYTLPFNTTVTELNQALAEFKFVSLSPRSTLFIDEPIRIPNFGILDLAYSDVQLADGANCYMIQNDDLFNGADVIGVIRGRINGNDVNQVRNLTGDYKTGYYGFGACFSKVKNLIMDDFYVANTNGWGIAYHLCGTVMFSNFEFDQNEKRRGVNGDGITGSAKRIYYDNLRGYTNDDLCAVTTGRSTLQGVDAGITDVENIDIELVSIKNICGVSKNGIKPHVGVGIYPTCGKKIKNVVIDGVSGDFDIYQYRLQNYWTEKGDGRLGNVTISNIDTSVNGAYGEVIAIASTDRLTIKSENSRTENLSKPILAVRNSGIKRLILDGMSNYSNGTSATSTVRVFNQNTNRHIDRIDLRACDIYRANETHENCLINVDWSVGSPPITIAAESCFVEGATSNGVLDKKGLIYGENANENINYIGSQLIKNELSLTSNWAGSVSVLINSSLIKLTGKITPVSITLNAAVFTLPKSFRPKDEEVCSLQSNTSSNTLKLKIQQNGDVVIIESNANESDVFNLNSIHFYKF